MLGWNGFAGWIGRHHADYESSHAKRGPVRRRPLGVESLEDRTLMSVSNLLGFAGLAFPDSGFSVPPDTHAAVGPAQVVEVVNSTVAFFDKMTGNNLSLEPLDNFFGVDLSVCDRSNIFDPKTSYDEIAGRFVVITLTKNPCEKSSHLLVAVSDDSDPNGAWEKHDIDVTEPSLNPRRGTTWGDFPGLGWDADAYYISLNMYTWKDKYDHVRITTIDKTSVLDGDPGTFTLFGVTRDGSQITLQPAVMHGAAAGDPMYFVEEAGYKNGSKIRIVEMTDKLSDMPTFVDTDIAVARYTAPPKASQPGPRKYKLETSDSSMLNAEWRDGRLVAAQIVGLRRRKEAHARWYEFNTTTMTLTQQGTIDPGKGVHTYFPSIAIAANGDLGLSYMQSSKREFMSVYVTGQRAGSAAGVVETAALVKAGEGTYTEFGRPPYRAGDYSSIVGDPTSGTSFWAANEYASAERLDNWGTWLVNFSLTG